MNSFQVRDDFVKDRIREAEEFLDPSAPPFFMPRSPSLSRR